MKKSPAPMGSTRRTLHLSPKGDEFALRSSIGVTNAAGGLPLRQGHFNASRMSWGFKINPVNQPTIRREKAARRQREKKPAHIGT